MATSRQHGPRRTDALSRERIVAAATRILDADGEAALTFRALTAALATGAGAIYWHVADKDDLLAATTDDVITGVLAAIDAGVQPREAVRALALGLYDAIDAHPWVGTQLSRAPWQPAMPKVFDSIGSRLQALGVPEPALFDAASALVHYILGVAAQNAANARQHEPGDDRTAFLTTVAARWAQLDPAQYPFLHQVTAQLREHDDRDQFLTGIDLILTGITTLR